MEILPLLLCSNHYTDLIDLAISCLCTSENKRVDFHLVTMEEHTELWSSFLRESALFSVLMV